MKKSNFKRILPISFTLAVLGIVFSSWASQPTLTPDGVTELSDYNALFNTQLQYVNDPSAIVDSSYHLGAFGGLFPSSEAALVTAIANPSTIDWTTAFDAHFEDPKDCPGYDAAGSSPVTFVHYLVGKEDLTKAPVQNRTNRTCMKFAHHTYLYSGGVCLQKMVLANSCFLHN